jgi:hydrogenase nickel incorporation protein HypB
MAQNDKDAQKNRQIFKEKDIVAVNLISSPGSGKTLLLEKTLERLAGKVKCAVITGDQQTDNDAVRMQGKGAKVVQIQTLSSCHLNAKQVNERLNEVLQDGVQLLFIENVGNLVCPASFDLGEEFKIALLSVTEGEDKPIKYPVLFNDAKVVVITKTDLLKYLDVSMNKMYSYINKVSRNSEIFELSAQTEEGFDAWINYLVSLVKGGQYS